MLGADTEEGGWIALAAPKGSVLSIAKYHENNCGADAHLCGSAALNVAMSGPKSKAADLEKAMVLRYKG
jgi:hypothetical protein